MAVLVLWAMSDEAEWSYERYEGECYVVMWDWVLVKDYSVRPSVMCVSIVSTVELDVYNYSVRSRLTESGGGGGGGDGGREWTRERGGESGKKDYIVHTWPVHTHTHTHARTHARTHTHTCTHTLTWALVNNQINCSIINKHKGVLI